MSVRALFTGLDIEPTAVTAAAGMTGFHGRVGAAVARAACSLDPADPVALAAAIEPLLARFARAAGVAPQRVALAVPGKVLRPAAAAGEHRWPEPVAITADRLTEVRRHALRRLGGSGTPVAWWERRLVADGRPLLAASGGQPVHSLRVDLDGWVVPHAAVAPAVDALASLGLALDLVLPRSLAAAEATLQAAERERGVLVVVLMPGQAEVAVFVDGGLHELFDVPLRPATVVMGASRREQLRRELAYRVVQVGTAIRRRLEAQDLAWQLGAGAVLTGEGAALPGVVSLARRALELPVRLGAPSLGASEHAGDPAGAAVLGLVLTQSRLQPVTETTQPFQTRVPAVEDRLPTRGFGPALGRWLREFVPSGSGI